MRPVFAALVIAGLLHVLSVSVASAGSAIAELPHRDPLQEAPPVLEKALRLPLSNEAPEEKISPRLWQKLLDLPDQEVSVIVEL